MAQGSKEKYSTEQKRKAEHIEQGYKQKGVSDKKAEAIAWATVNKHSGGGERTETHQTESQQKGQHKTGHLKSATEKKHAQQDSARRAAATRHAKDQPGALEQQTKQSLLEKARAKNIAGRSAMNKQELILALRKPHST